MNSDIKRHDDRAAGILAAIEADCDDHRMATLVDQPVDSAQATYYWSWRGDVSMAGLDDVLGRCLIHVCQHSRLSAVPATRQEACGIAFRLIEQWYRNEYGNGYGAAVAYVRRHGEDGMDIVLRAFVAGLKAHWRQLIIDAALSRHLAGLAWRDRQVIVDLIGERIIAIVGHDDGTLLEDASPANLADLWQAYCARHDDPQQLQQSHGAWLPEQLVSGMVRTASATFPT